MKIRPSIIILVAIVAMLIALLFWFRKEKQSTTSQVNSTTAANLAQPAVAPSLPSSNILVHANISAAHSAKRVSPSQSPPMSKVERTIGLLSEYNDIPIVFYGKVEDQFSNGVSDATVNFAVQVINGYESTTKRGDVASDANGFFTISPGYKGQNLAITPHKAGYTLATTGTLFWYSRLEEHPFTPDQNNPIIVKMWKLQGAEPLVSIDQHYKFPFTDKPIYFDLAERKIVPIGGDLKVIVTRAPGVITQRKQNHGDWSITLAPVNGGIMESDYHTAQVTFEAPADGYQDSYFVQMSHDDPGWFDNIQKEFFLMSRNGQVYSKFSFYFRINDDPNGTMYFEFKGVANTSNSRNWEATAP